jgi:excinuclease ABC subunit C
VEGISDTGMLAEVLSRRLNHPEWAMPDLMIIDGGLGQLNAVKKIIESRNLNIPLISIAKGPTRKGEKLFMTKDAPIVDRKIILAMRDESHRFAISYHRKLKRAGMWF